MIETAIHNILTEAIEFVKAVENRTGLKFTLFEEIGYIEFGLIRINILFIAIAKTFKTNTID